MKLHVTGYFLNATYANDAGRVIYKVKSPSLVSGSTTISRVLPADINIPRRNSDANNDSQERFAHLARIDWGVQSTSIHLLDQTMETRQFLRREPKFLSRNRIFIAPDGKEYKWILGAHTSQLILYDGKDTVTHVAKYHRGNLGITSEKRKGALEIYPAGEHMVDLILVTFLFIEKARRS
ncbi:hypothetical protein MPER_08219 [Moniliophthora perniciosa FA553]|nr:hypothetical protein MPER_08219 [Moniliophthora perniciosa FA553]